MIPPAATQPNAEKIELSGVQETLLITLHARALESRSPDPILRDETAERLVESIAYDFARLKSAQGDRFTTSVRAKQLDAWTREYLEAHPDATVLHLGCGLDSRVIRVAPPPTVRWFEVDLPEVIAARRRLYPEQPHVEMIGVSVTEPTWLGQIADDRPTLVVAEGLLPYLSAAEVEDLLRRIVVRFPEGQVLFDALSPRALRSQGLHSSLRKTGAQLVWGLDDPHELESHVFGLELMDEWPLIGSPDVAKLGWLKGKVLAWAAKRPRIARMHRVLRYRF
ncbi:class I SAM-dependent methyltransferase [Nannocystis bainbridge]|uniref:Class I SAM-dependent methyltransferase n=1 Tax=Nannocystis bainbridge TaxID=2995303 RepID=A0ABT5E2A1_9BACT|nr:class I SAM-dependent methyltransferase [Nannocystis bainbridge]MDC0719997.1 class I SAM-dependent methyltransferase [Nannocystis bainbridge]